MMNEERRSAVMRPLYRSRLFWLGVPGLVFLLWVWWDSGGYVSFAAYERGNELRQVEVGRGGVLWTYAFDPKPTGHAAVRPFRAERIELAKMGVETKGRRLDFSEAFKRERRMVSLPAFGVKKEVHTVLLALWVIVLGYIAMWLGGVFAWRWWKVRVMRRLTEMGAEVAG
jgi:hypothetical protein